MIAILPSSRLDILMTKVTEADMYEGSEANRKKVYEYDSGMAKEREEHEVDKEGRFQGPRNRLDFILPVTYHV